MNARNARKRILPHSLIHVTYGILPAVESTPTEISYTTTERSHRNSRATKPPQLHPGNTECREEESTRKKSRALEWTTSRTKHRQSTELTPQKTSSRCDWCSFSFYLKIPHLLKLPPAMVYVNTPRITTPYIPGYPPTIPIPDRIGPFPVLSLPDINFN